MRFNEVFESAIWIGAEGNIFPIFRKSFTVGSPVVRASIRILGLGASLFYINGKAGTEDLYAPVDSDFEERGNKFKEYVKTITEGTK